MFPTRTEPGRSGIPKTVIRIAWLTGQEASVVALIQNLAAGSQERERRRWK